MSKRNHSGKWLIAAIIVPIVAALIGATATIYSSQIQLAASEAGEAPPSGQSVNHKSLNRNEIWRSSDRPPSAAKALLNIEGLWDLPSQKCKYPMKIEVIGEEIVLTRADGVEAARYRVKSANDTLVRTREGTDFYVYSDALVYSDRRFRRCD